MLKKDRYYEQGKDLGVCKECGKPIKGFKWALSDWLCSYCYRGKFPERKMWNLAPVRVCSGGRWLDLRPVMSWAKDRSSIVNQSDLDAVQESRRLLKEERNE